MNHAISANMAVLVAIIVATGLIGGLINSWREERKASDDTGPKPTHIYRYNIALSLVAAFLVPLFLNIISSDIMEKILDAPATAKAVVEYLVTLFIFVGFCLAAAVSSVRFVGTVADKALEMAETAKQSARSAQKSAQTAQDVATEVQDTIEEIANEPEDDGVIMPQNMPQIPALSPQEIHVIEALGHRPTLRRSVSGIVGDPAIPEATSDRDAVTSTLGDLVHKKLVEAIPSRKDGRPRYRLSSVGHAQFRKISSNA